MNLLINGRLEKMSDDAIQATNEESRGEEFSRQLKGKKLSWQKLRRNDSLEMESGKFSGCYFQNPVAFPAIFKYSSGPFLLQLLMWHGCQNRIDAIVGSKFGTIFRTALFFVPKWHCIGSHEIALGSISGSILRFGCQNRSALDLLLGPNWLLCSVLAHPPVYGDDDV